MKMKQIEILISVLALLCLGSCSIKENRMDCPCRFNVDLSECGYVGSLDLRLWCDGLNVFERRLKPDDSLEIDIPRQKYSFSALPAVLEYMVKDKTDLAVAENEQFPAVNMYCNSHLNAVCETVFEKVILHKQYAEIFLDAENFDLNGIEFRLKGETSGFSIVDLSPIEGPFDCRMTVNGNVVSARIPRQNGKGLKIDINGSGHSGTFDLSAYLEKEGYDWTREDLEDVYIKISALKSYVEIGIEDWDKMILDGGST